MKTSDVICTVKRGQVWYIEVDKEISTSDINRVGNSITAKGRPWLIVSCEKNNIHSTTFNAVPISTGADYYPMHVAFNYNGRPQVIQCEQIRTWNLSDLTDYKYSLSDAFMEKVDIALANQLGLSMQIPSFGSIVEVIEKIAKIKASEFNSQYQKVTDEAIQEIASRLENIFKVDKSALETYSQSLADKVELPEPKVNITKATEINPVKNVQDSNSNSSDTAKVVSAVEEKPVEPNKESAKRTPISQMSSKGQNKWTEENKIQFLIDCDNYGPETVAKMWGLKDKKAVYTYKYLFKK